MTKAVDPSFKIAVIDDDQSCRNALAQLLAAGGLNVREYGSAREFLGSPDCESVSCVISDLRMPEVNGLQLQATLLERMPDVSLLLVTGYGEVPESVSAMKAGAVDFLEKPVKGAVMMEAIHRAAARSRQLKAASIQLRELQKRFERLTPRERQVMALVSAGLLNKQIAAELSSAVRTIKQHRGSVMSKMAAETLADLIIMAERLGIRPEGADFSKAKGRISTY
jgi:FixJ family two-component response regulator